MKRNPNEQQPQKTNWSTVGTVLFILAAFLVACVIGVGYKFLIYVLGTAA